MDNIYPRNRQMFLFPSKRRHTSWPRDWSSDVCSSDLFQIAGLHQFVLANLGDRIPVHIYNNRGHPESSRLFALRQEGGGGETKSISALAKRQRVSFYRLRYASMIRSEERSEGIESSA